MKRVILRRMQIQKIDTRAEIYEFSLESRADQVFVAGLFGTLLVVNSLGQALGAEGAKVRMVDQKGLRVSGSLLEQMVKVVRKGGKFHLESGDEPGLGVVGIVHVTNQTE